MPFDNLKVDKVKPDFSFEKEQQVNNGFKCIVGVDEAGRGPWAGPIIAAAVWFSKFNPPDKIDDSKRLSIKNRDLIYDQLINSPDVHWAVAIIEADEIDQIGLGVANIKALAYSCNNLIKKLNESNLPKPDIALVDGKFIKEYPIKFINIIKGDSKSISISAASIIAKVTRDRIMLKYARIFPDYEFDKHKGYGTKLHQEALDKFGICKIHRKSFKPIKLYEYEKT